jgi:hypothetical protein
VKQKCLRQLARELEPSHSYPSQVKHGKRPASARVVSTMASITKLHSSALCYNLLANAELCSGSTGDFGSLSPGSNPGSAANQKAFPGSSTVEWAAVNRLVAGSSPARGAKSSNRQNFSFRGFVFSYRHGNSISNGYLPRLKINRPNE